MINATECCKTVGCNCAGSITNDLLNNHPYVVYAWIIPLMVLIIIMWYAINIRGCIENGEKHSPGKERSGKN